MGPLQSHFGLWITRFRIVRLRDMLRNLDLRSHWERSHFSSEIEILEHRHSSVNFALHQWSLSFLRMSKFVFWPRFFEASLTAEQALCETELGTSGTLHSGGILIFATVSAGRSSTSLTRCHNILWGRKNSATIFMYRRYTALEVRHGEL